jgi:hypothetical protein
MFLVGILTWWYGDGWRKRAMMIGSRIGRTSDYFSIGLLLTTLFSPFRQISAGAVDGPFTVQVRAMMDKLISRMIGAIVRIFMIFFGIVTICLQAIFGGIELVFWAVIPAFPVIGLIMTVIGWVPTWL